MRKLSRLESPPELTNALCFLCVSRAVAETAERDRNAYITGFEQDLAKWADILPGIKKICSLIWKIRWDAIPRLQPHFSTKLKQLRKSVAELLMRANTILGLKPHGADQEHPGKLEIQSQQRRANIEYGSLATESPDPPPTTARQKKPPDRDPHQDKPLPFTAMVTLVKSIVFALVVHFILSLYILTPTGVMLPNPWQNRPSQDATDFQATPLETYQPSYSGTSTQPCPSTDLIMLDGELPQTVNLRELELTPRAHFHYPYLSWSI
ncbi:hypothetical protein EKO27_g2926 [Xylaria grammica]|uniref:Uncharacterized protein n=1 Tax=Xylaria grammica TaxID=363999 RepID=A0A439DCT8_9PEZI|nr:hypothetical protein EKO27_g2926 [Xylaria grammica]